MREEINVNENCNATSLITMSIIFSKLKRIKRGEEGWFIITEKGRQVKGGGGGAWGIIGGASGDCSPSKSFCFIRLMTGQLILGSISSNSTARYFSFRGLNLSQSFDSAKWTRPLSTIIASIRIHATILNLKKKRIIIFLQF